MDYLPPCQKYLELNSQSERQRGLRGEENREIGMQAFVHGRAKIGESIG